RVGTTRPRQRADTTCSAAFQKARHTACRGQPSAHPDETPMKTPFAFRWTWMAAALMAWLLAACGGGGSSDGADAVSQDKAQSMSADSSVLSTDGTDGAVALLTT